MAGLLTPAQEFLAAEVNRPFKWGETDCGMMADRWVQSRLGFSPLKKYGRVYDNYESAMDWLTEPGGLVKGALRVCRHAGLRRAEKPQDGDLGLFGHDGLIYMGLCNGDYFVSRHLNKWILAPIASATVIWKVE